MSEQKNISVKEFKMWLEGVEEMQEEGWTPNSTQWVRIRDKIRIIEETTGGFVQPQFGPRQQPVGQPPAPAPMPVMQAPHQFAPAGMTSLTPPEPAGRSPLTGGPTTIPIKTPDIDTSNGGYRSSFA